MNVLNLRFSNKDYTYVVMAGSKAKPVIKKLDTVKYPKNFSKPRSLNWQLKEIMTLIKNEKVGKIVIKKFEGQNRDKKFVDRIEHEAMALLADERSGLKAIFKKANKTIAKDLGKTFGFKGKAKYLSTSLDTTLVPDYQRYDSRTTDAIHAAWSELK